MDRSSANTRGLSARGAGVIEPASGTASEGGGAGPMEIVARRYHLHVPGIIYIATMMLLGVGAINSQNNLLFWAFGLAVAGLLISGLLSGAALMGVRLERERVEDAGVGDELAIAYRVHNRGRFIPGFALSISETPRQRRRRPAPTWPARLPRPMAFVAHVGPRQTVRAVARVRPTSRGLATFDAVEVTTGFPFGLTRKSVVFARPQSCVVRPALLPVREGLVRELASRGDEGRVSAQRSGQEPEFVGLRDYVPGDVSRLIAWRPSARLGRLVVRQTAAATAPRVWIALDGAPSADAALFETAVSLAASLVEQAAREGLAVGLWTPWSGAPATPRAARKHAEMLLSELGRVDRAAPRAEAGVALQRRRSDALIICTAGDVGAGALPGARVVRAEDAPRLVPGTARAARSSRTGGERRPRPEAPQRGAPPADAPPTSEPPSAVPPAPAAVRP